MKMRNEEEGRRRVTPTFFFLRGVPNDRTRTRGCAYFCPLGSVFPGEDPGAFGIRYLLVTTNIIQGISIMSRGKICGGGCSAGYVLLPLLGLLPLALRMKKR